MPNRVAVAAFAVAALVGCTDPDDDATGTVGGGKGDGISEFRIKLTWSNGMLRGLESPKLPGAFGTTSSFACPIDDRNADGYRLVCNRGDEQLSLTYGPTEREGAAVYVGSELAPDQRSYYHCSASFAPAGKWPYELRCTSAQPRTTVDGQMVSPFSSSVAELGIYNAHPVGQGGNLFRGMKPFRDSDFDDLGGLGVDAVLIFKKPTQMFEVEDEVDALAPFGVPASQIVNVAFPWKDFTSFIEPCRMTVRSLKLLKDWTASGKTTFFHCTVGEDRTGYLAGLYRLLTETAPREAIFEEEMCERGYSAGNPQKPFAGVVAEVDADLTPLFLKMAFKIANGELSINSLDDSVCATDPATDPDFVGEQWDAEAYRCVVSTRYRL